MISTNEILARMLSNTIEGVSVNDHEVGDKEILVASHIVDLAFHRGTVVDSKKLIKVDVDTAFDKLVIMKLLNIRIYVRKDGFSEEFPLITDYDHLARTAELPAPLLTMLGEFKRKL